MLKNTIWKKNLNKIFEKNVEKKIMEKSFDKKIMEK